jgi:hypothetical protein
VGGMSARERTAARPTAKVTPVAVSSPGGAPCRGGGAGRGTDLQAPVPFPTLHRFTGQERAERTDRLGGLVHEYRVAA